MRRVGDLLQVEAIKIQAYLMPLSPDDRSADLRDARIIKYVSLTLALVAAGIGVYVFSFTIYVVAVGFRYWEEILRDHFAAIIGLPGAAAVSFAIVVFLRQTDGPIEFEGLGFKFKGAAGQVVMWIACFLAIAAAIRMCW